MNPIHSGPRTHSPHERLARLKLATGALAVTLVSLAGCGGGGGGETSGPSSARITEQSAEVIISNAYRTSDALYGNGNDAATTSLDLKDASRHRKTPMVDLALQRLTYLAGDPSSTASRYAKSVSTDSASCDGGGFISVAINDADNSGDPSTGDSVQFEFVNCRNAGWLMNGRMSLTGLVMTGGPYDPARSLGATFTFHSLTGSNGSLVETIDGAFSIHASVQTYPTRIIESTVAGSSFRVSSGGNSGELRNFALEARSAVNAGTYSYGIRATVIDSGRGSMVTISNPEQFSGVNGAFPTRGSLFVRESDGSAARLTATSSTSVRIDVDANGDGTFESSITRTWAEIAGS